MEGGGLVRDGLAEVHWDSGDNSLLVGGLVRDGKRWEEIEW